MSGLICINQNQQSPSSVHLQENGNSLRVAAEPPHLISFGRGRLSTAVTIHPVKQGRVTIGSDPSSDIVLQGTGVQKEHCKVENSNGVVTLYPIQGNTQVDGVIVNEPIRLSQGCMISIGRSNYLRFNHPEEANLMKSVLPNTRISMAPINFSNGDGYEVQNVHASSNGENSSNGQVPTKANRNDIGLYNNGLEIELNMTYKELSKRKPPVAPRKMYKDFDQISNSSCSDQETVPRSESPPKVGGIMSKVSKFEYYVKNSQKSGKTPKQPTEAFSPKVFSSNSLTLNTPAKDVLGKNTPGTYSNSDGRRIMLNENNGVDAKNCAYTNVTVKSQIMKIDQLSRSFSIDSNDEKYNKSIKLQSPSACFNRNPTFKDDNMCDANGVSGISLSEAQRQNVHLALINDEKEKILEQERLDEIINMCAEYEKQMTLGIPTTPTEKRPNKIITNGSLPRTTYASHNLVQTSDGCFKFNTGNRRYENVPPQSPISPVRSPICDGKPHNYENIPTINQNDVNIIIRPDHFIQNTRQFPITELSSPVMIRKIARNAQNASRNENSSPQLDNRLKSPYENINIFNLRGTPPNVPTYINLSPKSPNSHSPRTRIRTTYAHKNVPQSPQHFVFPSSSPQYERSPCTGIEKKLSLTEDIPMIDDTNFANELEMRISKLKPDTNKGYEHENLMPDIDIKLDEIVFDSQRRNFEDIKKHLIAGIPELDEIHRHIDKDLSQSFTENKSIDNNEQLKMFSEEMKNIPLEDDVFEKPTEQNQSTDNLQSKSNNEEYEENQKTENHVQNHTVNENDISNRLEVLRCERKKCLSEIHGVKRQMAEVRAQEDDILRELEMEKALIQGEYYSEIAILKVEQRNLTGLYEKVKQLECDMSARKADQEKRHQAASQAVQKASSIVTKIEKAFTKHDATLEELRNAQEILEMERKAFEDMEFQDLEEEADWLSYREELQHDIMSLTQKIDAQKSRILNLKFETSNSLNSAVEETKSLQSEYAEMLNQVEKLTLELQEIENNIKNAVLEIGAENGDDSDRRNSSLEERRSRIKSGDFSPPSSDNEELNNVEMFETRKKSLNEKFNSIDQMSRSMIVDLGDKRSIYDLIDPDEKDIESKSQVDSSPEQNKTNNDKSPSKEQSPDIITESKPKKGFWERNFDSLSRLKNKDKKNKNKTPDIMSQSLNENMFFNNDNIESDFGSFEKFNSLRSSKKKKNKNSDESISKDGENKTKISITSLGKIMRKDSIGKKSKEEKIDHIPNNVTENKENIDANVSVEHSLEGVDSKSTKCHRYVKNSKTNGSENKYLNKYTKVSLQSTSVSPENDQNPTEEANDDENCRYSYTDSLEEEVRIIDPVSGNTIRLCAVNKIQNGEKTVFRKSAGDEHLLSPNTSLMDQSKIPSQDDIDRISKVTLDAPLLSQNENMNSLGRRTIDNLREIERNRVAMLEQQGCQVMDDEREKIQELKKRIQNETKLKWEEDQLKSAQSLKTNESDEAQPGNSEPEILEKTQTEENITETSINTTIYTNSTYEHSSINASGLNDSIQDVTASDRLRHSQTDSNNSSAFIEDDSIQKDGYGNTMPYYSRPLSELSDMSSENASAFGSSLECGRRPKKSTNSYRLREDPQRPLTRYLPIHQEDLDLRKHIDTAGHQVDLCPHVVIDSISCRGYLHKLGAKFHGWSKRWFVFDRSSKTFIYYSDKSERKPRGGAYFQVIEEVYMDHLNVSKSPTPQTTFVIKTRQRKYYLMAPSGQAARIWIDVIFTGAQGYTEYME